MKITDHHIATLCDIARAAGTDLSRDKKATLPELLASGHIAPAETKDGAPVRYKLTSAGQALLDARGVGANES